ncbi:MAG: alpha-amylase family glycosyl hydrolase [Saprospiraceae bacterium]
MRPVQYFLALLFLAGISTYSCKRGPATVETNMQDTILPMDWVKNANIYEVNIRQYTPEGTFNAFRTHLPRLKEMGVDVLWLMPIYPVSKDRRKGSLGSYYAVGDYKGINPEFGSLDDFKALLGDAHNLGMKVILDWVANHTGWDNPWIKEHPEWFTQNDKGQIIDPIGPDGKSWGWTDVADLEFSNMEMRQAMIDAMKYWVGTVGVDGFRCDVAGAVPDDFWVDARAQLDSIRPVFMLAEAEHPPHRNNESFQMSYGWSFHHIMNKIAKGEEDATAIGKWLEEDRAKYEKGFHMHFITNHDENSWNGTEFERLGEGVKTFAVLAYTFDGMPLTYSGQESALDKRLRFFEKDTIQWGNFPMKDFYTTLLQLKHQNKALWNGEAGGEPRIIGNSNEKAVVSYLREKDENRVVVVLNLTGEPQEVSLKGNDYVGDYTNVFANRSQTLTEDMVFQLNPWDYLVLSK